MIDPDLRAVAGCITEAKQALAVDRPLRILVLGDPDARMCRFLADAGHAVACCPDLQRPRGTEADHVHVSAPTAMGLVELQDRIDVAVAVAGWGRILSTHSETSLRRLVDWLREYCTLTIVRAPRRPLGPDLNELGPYEVLAVLGAFRYLAEAVGIEGDESLEAPLVLASDQFLVLGEEWVRADGIERLGELDPSGQDAPVRTFRIPGSRIAKVECASEEYFDRTQVIGEWAFLSGVDPQVRDLLDLPRVHLLNRGRSVLTLVRDDVVGKAEDLSVADQLAGVLDVAARYSQVGLFHNDLRPWNVVWHEGAARLIDFEWTSGFDEDAQGLPQVLALAGTLAGIATDEIRMGEPFHGDVLDIATRSGLLERWPLSEQLTQPWVRFPGVRDRIDVAGGMSAPEILRAVLEVTVA